MRISTLLILFILFNYVSTTSFPESPKRAFFFKMYINIIVFGFWNRLVNPSQDVFLLILNPKDLINRKLGLGVLSFPAFFYLTLATKSIYYKHPFILL